MKLFVLLLALVALSHAVKWNELHSYTFEQYKQEFSKFYGHEEYSFRKQLFESNLAEIRLHNSDPTKTWKKGINQFADRTEKEFRQLLGVKKSLLYQQKFSRSQYRPESDPVDLSQLPLGVDWRDSGIITDVKDQGNCGSCWTFATAEATESYLALATGKLHVLSEQQILDCTPNPQQCGGTGGCGGGTAELAWARITQMGGLNSEWTYPYTSYFGAASACNFGRASPVANVTSFVNLPVNEQDPILTHISNIGPLAISVDASTWSFYESGIFDGCNKTNPDIDHAVLLVGYGTDPATRGDYWIVRNSWSPSWGESGYIRLHRSQDFTCGIDLTPGDGDGCSGGPPTVKVCGTCGILFDGVYPVIGV